MKLKKNFRKRLEMVFHKDTLYSLNEELYKDLTNITYEFFNKRYYTLLRESEDDFEGCNFVQIAKGLNLTEEFPKWVEEQDLEFFKKFYTYHELIEIIE